MCRMLFTRLILTVAGLCLPFAIHADERILSYHSDIRIERDGSMLVTEIIRVRAEGNQIRRGIYRDFPTDYKDRLGNSYVVGFDLQSVSRDGASEPYREQRQGNGVRLYLGNANVFLQPGEYEYRIAYRTTRQLGFFEKHDELYWNVTGNGWNFAIDQASASVSLPEGFSNSDLVMEGYTGRQGSQEQAYAASVSSNGGNIATNRVLQPKEGLTLVFSFPKGIITEPSKAEKVQHLLNDNRSLLLGLLALFGSFFYLLFVWHKFGRDPKPGVIFPRYESPKEFSPASARYIQRMRYDNLCFTSAIVNLSVKGHILIEAEETTAGKVIESVLGIDMPETYTLRRQQSNQPLAAGEKQILNKLFSTGSEVQLKQVNHSLISKTISAHKASLKRDYFGTYFKNNAIMLLPSIFLVVVLSIIGVMSFAISPVFIVLMVLALVLHGFFAFLLKAPSPKGRRLMDELEGFKDYMQVAEKEHLTKKAPWEMTPELFERFLPFAIALGVAQAWAKNFTRVFAKLSQATGNTWHPLWYSGHFDVNRMSDFTTQVSTSFNTAISSASTAPGSTSGSGGGGSSGGGGGGGGGGGW